MKLDSRVILQDWCCQNIIARMNIFFYHSSNSWEQFTIIVKSHQSRFVFWNYFSSSFFIFIRISPLSNIEVRIKGQKVVKAREKYRNHKKKLQNFHHIPNIDSHLVFAAVFIWKREVLFIQFFLFFSHKTTAVP